MVLQLVIGMLIIGLTVFVHAIALHVLERRLLLFIPVLAQRFLRTWRSILMMLAVLGVFLVNVFQIWLWAAFFLLVGELHTLEESLYFSTSSFTTVGYGDVVLSHKWRLLGSFTSANGMILFGWSTAFIFSILRMTYRDFETAERRHKTQP